MLAIEESQRLVVLCLRPDIVLRPSASEKAGKTAVDDIIARFEDQYYELRSRKQVHLTREDADRFFEHLSSAVRGPVSESFARGLSEVVVFDDLYDDDDIDHGLRTRQFIESLETEWGAGSMYCSASDWECLRYLEFFFPFLDSLPTERTLALIKSDGIRTGSIGGGTLEEAVEAQLAAAGLLVVRRQQMELSREKAELLCKDLAGTPQLAGAVGVLTSEPGAVAMCLEGRGAVGRWQLICGPSNSGFAREIAPSSLRAIWGTDGTSNALHASASIEAAEEELAALFPSVELQRTLCVITSEALPFLHQICSELEAAGFTFLKQKQLRLTEAKARELYAVHEGEAHFQPMLEEILAGPCVVAVLLRLEAVSVLQQLLGPASVEEARQSRPGSLRARFGSAGWRSAVHSSASPGRAAWEVRLLFPEMEAGSIPSGNEVRDFLFRKAVGASTELKTLSEAELATLGYDPTLQQLLQKGLLELAQQQPKGVAAPTWLSRWLAERNPNTQHRPVAGEGGGLLFDPPSRRDAGAGPRRVEHGISKDGLPFSVEAPAPRKVKKIIDVDTTLETHEQKGPYVVFVCGGPGSGKTALCARLADELDSVVHLDFAEALRKEEAAGTYLGTEIFKHRQAGAGVPDELQLQLLKSRLLKQREPKRYLLDGFPVTLDQAMSFEQQIAEVAYVLHLDAMPETMKKRIESRAALRPGRPEDEVASVEQRLQTFTEETSRLLSYYGPIGKVRKADAEQSAEDVYEEVRRYASCRLVCLLGPPGTPLRHVAQKLENKFGYFAIDVPELLRKYAETAPKEEEEAITQAMGKGLPVVASVAAPVVVSALIREMALGISNFVLTGFPQSSLQAKFIDTRLPSFLRPLLVDLNRPDAEDLAAAASCPEPLLDLRMEDFYGASFQSLLKPGPEQLRDVVRIPCSLGSVTGLAGAMAAGTQGMSQRLLGPMWSGVCGNLMPSLTVVLGPPGSGADALAGILAAGSVNSQAVDCSLLVEREIERYTEVGIKMRHLRERGEAIPLTMTLELLKDIVNLTCSDSLIVTGLPTSVEEIPRISEDFRIDRVYCLQASEMALHTWRETYISQKKDGAKTFDDYMKKASPIASHFARQGKLERIDVGDTPLPPRKFFSEEIRKSTVPQIAIVTGLSESTTAQQASLLAEAYGVGISVNVRNLQKWAASVGRTLNTSSPKDVVSTLRRYADAYKYSFLVLERYPSTAEDANALIKEFGSPRVVVNISLEDEALTEELNAKAEEAEDPPGEEEIAEMLKSMRAAVDGVLGVFSEKCPTTVLQVPWMPESVQEELLNTVRRRLRPRAFAVVTAPGGPLPNLGCRVADSICALAATRAPSGDGRRPTNHKYMVLDSNELVKRGRHAPKVEDSLAKASLVAAAPDHLSAQLWSALFEEAFAASADPMGTFLVTNFPTLSSVTSTPRVRDQLHLLGEVASLMGILHVKVSDDAFMELCSEDKRELNAYRAFAEEISSQCTAQFHEHQVCECTISSPDDLGKTLRQVAKDFRLFQERAENGPSRP